MVQLNESAFRSGARELSPSLMRPTIYRPSRPVVTRTERATTETKSDSAAVDRGQPSEGDSRGRPRH